MSEEQFQERTERATPKREQEARDKGQVPRSRELNTMAVTMAAAASLIILSGSWGDDLVALFKAGLDLRSLFSASAHGVDEVIDLGVMTRAFSRTVRDALLMLFPLFAVLTATAFFAPLALGGWSFSAKAIAFKGEKLNPLKGLKRIFALRGLMELGKALAKFLLIASVGAATMTVMGPQFLGLSGQPIEIALVHAASLWGWFFMILSSSLLIIAAIDVPFQIWDHAKQLRMTKQQVKDESKETEVNPEIKGRIRAIQQQMAQGRMLLEIPSADVVITNPTHYSVALKYAEGEMGAPIVVAKGVDHLAQKIREIARENRVPLFEAPSLARAIYATTKLGKEIPGQLYVAVAQVLIYLHQLRSYRKLGGDEPEKPQVDVEED